ncbi:MAG TPA: hypothetical protein PK264_06975, partial [Hyphomicrobiaceae bacterium]|nr:hypothetical protein [Hyphomicrobiaceae bacterium]
HLDLIAASFQQIRTAQDRLARHRLRRRITPADLGPSHPLRSLIERWREVGAVWDRERLDGIIRSALDDRYVLASPSTTGNQVTICDVGSGYGLFNGSWLSRCRGLSMSDMPDYRYGRWVADAHIEAAKDEEPLLEHVDVAICWPRQEPRRHVYQRVILPVGTGKDRRLLSASILDSALAFDVEAGDER